MLDKTFVSFRDKFLEALFFNECWKNRAGDQAKLFTRLALEFEQKSGVPITDVYDLFVDYSQFRARSLFSKWGFKNVPDASQFPEHSAYDEFEVTKNITPLGGWIMSEKSYRDHTRGTSMNIDWEQKTFRIIPWSSDD